MRCKPGDLAFIVGATKWPELNGVIVRVLRRAVPGEITRLSDGKMFRSPDTRTCDWWIEREGGLLPIQLIDNKRKTKYPVNVKQRPFPDHKLRPIRAQPGQDETLTWKDVPTKEIA